jgi:hypothetical protein
MYQALVIDKSGKTLNAVPVQFGIPLPKGQHFNPRDLELATDDDHVIESEIMASALWHDNSIKWCLVEACLTIEAGQELKLFIRKRKLPETKARCLPVCISESTDDLTIESKQHTLIFDKKYLRPFKLLSKSNEKLLSDCSCTLIMPDGEKLDAIIDNFSYRSSPSTDCLLSSRVMFEGEFRSAGTSLARFTATTQVFHHAESIKLSFTLHNPRAAQHQSGLWDLGDPNSIYFKGCEFSFSLHDDAVLRYRTEDQSAWKAADDRDIVVYQESSGGDNWNSPNHKNRENLVPLKHQGYTCSAGEKTVSSGKRASPTFSLRSDKGAVSFYIENFWQQFPSSIEYKDRTVCIGMFPARFDDGFELQAGEKKTQCFYMSLLDDREALSAFSSPPEIRLNPLWIEHCRVFNSFSLHDLDDPLQSIIFEGLDSSNNFFAKREAIDEFGWRSFGDIYADHETDGYTGSDLFISHYNNQYDPVYGFLRQYALTADHRWLELADDLAHHVCDIDIYHTIYDKEEYNGGLFWHTDHYLDAATSTHRSYSRHQEKDAYVDHAGGGGPGGQHCYTSGLLYHYLITGNEASREALFKLTEWVSHVYEYERSGSIFDVLLAVKNRHRIDLKNVLTLKYPLDRGTANYINALLDCYELTLQRSTLERVEYVIRNTVHPCDDLELRELENVEICWFYTVFLQSVCRYLQIKQAAAELDDDFYYARDALLHYADWMADNEHPYLDNPDILEFPNSTWTAQDLRKVNVLYLADYYFPGDTDRYIKTADEIYDFITTSLSNDNTRTYTRILSLLMQNHGVVSSLRSTPDRPDFAPLREYTPLPKHTTLRAALNIASLVFNALRHFSIRREIRWLARRSDRIARLSRFHP